MRRNVLTDLKYRIGSCRFVCAVVLMTAAFAAAGSPYIKQLLNDGYSMEGAGWLSAYRFALTSEKGALLIPIAAALAVGSEIEDEIRSRYVLAVCIRTNKKSYLAGKMLSAAFAGGLAILLGAVVLLGILYITVGDIPLLEGQQAVDTISFVRESLFRCFLNGVLWSLVGNCFAVMTKNRYMLYAVPFVFYYVLTVFQERYYPTLLILSPREWAAPFESRMNGGIGMLLFLSLLMAAVLVLQMKRRIDHA